MQPRIEFMKRAIAKAKEALAVGEYPIGAVVVINDAVVSASYPALDSQPDPTAHAEIMALRLAASALGTRTLDNAVLYSTLEPCPMCMSAAIWAKCDTVVYGASQEDAVAASTQALSGQRTFRQIRIKAHLVAERGVPTVKVVEHFLREECIALLKIRTR